MPPLLIIFCLVVLCGVLLVLPVADPVLAADPRPAAWAGAFYPAEKDALRNTIDSFTEKARTASISLPDNSRLRALIMPHAGYRYSGQTAAYASRVLQPGQFKKVILMGPDHRVGFRNGAVGRRDYQTPLGTVRLHPDAADLLLAHPSLYQVVPASESAEHSLEVILPFLQRYLQNFALVPIAFGPGDVQRLAQSLLPLLNDDTVLVVSSDLSHYLPYEQAEKVDKDTIDKIMGLDLSGFHQKKGGACGAMPISVILAFADHFGWQPVFLHYSNSGDATGDYTKVVGYTTIAFYEKKGRGSKAMNTDTSGGISEEVGQGLVLLARHTIMEQLGENIDDEQKKTYRDILGDPVLQKKQGVFVTLKRHGQLRGCIGSLTGYEPIIDGVRNNALKAAFQDHRFSPLEKRELDRLHLEVSILTEPQPLDFSDSRDLVKKLRPNIDGVIIRKGFNSATFLPQVWEQLPQPEMFLANLCRKAGLAIDSWQQPGLQVETYQVQYFEED